MKCDDCRSTTDVGRYDITDEDGIGPRLHLCRPCARDYANRGLEIIRVDR